MKVQGGNVEHKFIKVISDFGAAGLMFVLLGLMIKFNHEDRLESQVIQRKLMEKVVINEQKTERNTEQTIANKKDIQRNTETILVNKSDIKRISEDLFEVKVRLKHLEGGKRWTYF